jgi:hypothetical protein
MNSKFYWTFNGRGSLSGRPSAHCSNKSAIAGGPLAPVMANAKACGTPGSQRYFEPPTVDLQALLRALCRNTGRRTMATARKGGLCEFLLPIHFQQLGLAATRIDRHEGILPPHRCYQSNTSTVQGESSWGQGIHFALILATLCYQYILYFALSGSRQNTER